MQKTVVIAGADDSLGKMLVKSFTENGWRVYAGFTRKPDAECPNSFGIDPINHFYTLAARQKVGVPVDMLIVNINGEFGNNAVAVLDGVDFNALTDAYDYNTLGPLRVINTFLPLLDKGAGKRICVVTTRESSNYLCEATVNYADHISRAPLNMAMTQLFNALHPDGYTFRMYCRDTENGNDKWAFDYFVRNRSYEPEDLKHSDEERIVLRDWRAREIPW